MARSKKRRWAMNGTILESNSDNSRGLMCIPLNVNGMEETEEDRMILEFLEYYDPNPIGKEESQ